MIYTAIDIESTDKYPNETNEVLSFGYIRFDENFRVYDKGVLYFYKPFFKIDGTPAQQVHGLTSAFLSKYANEFDVNIAKAYSLCYGSFLVGKNSSVFDIPLLKIMFEKYASGVLPLFVYASYDTQKFVRKDWKEHTGNNRAVGTLSDYCNMYGITEDNIRKFAETDTVNQEILKQKDIEAYNKSKSEFTSSFHDALFDCAATVLVLKEYITRSGEKL